MPKPNRIIRPPSYWESKIWEMKWEQLPNLPEWEPTQDEVNFFYEDTYDRFINRGQTKY